MSAYLFYLGFLLLTLPFTLFSQNEQPSVAILDFDAQNISLIEATSLSDLLRTIIKGNESISVIERDVMRMTLEEENFQVSGCTSQECAVRVGQLLGAANIVVGSVGRIGTTFSVDLRSIDVESGKINSSVFRDYQGEFDILLEIIPAIAEVLFPPVEPEILFQDEFSGKTLDHTKWNVFRTGFSYNSEQQAYVDSPSTLYILHGNAAMGAEDGALAIHLRHNRRFRTLEGDVFDFLSGRINTKGLFEFTHATVSARIKLPAGSGYWPAFWVLGEGEWPEVGEIDIMENAGEASWFTVAIHGPGDSVINSLASQVHYPAGSSSTDWHVYEMELNSESITYKLDDMIVYSVSRTTVEERGPWLFDAPKYLILNLAVGGSYPLSVNEIQRPYLGVPNTTVRAIRQNEGLMLVDWVRVTR